MDRVPSSGRGASGKEAVLEDAEQAAPICEVVDGPDEGGLGRADVVDRPEVVDRGDALGLNGPERRNAANSPIGHDLHEHLQTSFSSGELV